nr:NADH dehydrogenase subunit 5 [Pseudoacanthocephalus sp.]
MLLLGCYFLLFGICSVVSGIMVLCIPIFNAYVYTSLKLGDMGSSVLLVVVSIYVGVLLFSLLYMHQECFNSVFLSVMSVFVMGIVVLLMGSDFYVNVIGWEVLGLSSFVLIAFYGSRGSWFSAYLTVLVNRVGDVGFIVIMFSCVVLYVMGGWGGVVTVWGVSLSVFVVLASKSAQYPLSGWLPLAMAAPTPVSALVHSSTLVIAGLYMYMFMSSYGGSGGLFVSNLVVVGVVSLFMAGLAVLWEGDFKKVVAMSTATHLSLILLLCLMCSTSMAVTHMVFHALYKSAVFVVIGLGIWLLFHEQDYRGVLGGGGSINGILGSMMLISVWGLMGLVGTSGWLVKDMLMCWGFESGYSVFISLGVIIMLATSLVYCVKLLWVVVGSSPMSGVKLGGYGFVVLVMLPISAMSLVGGVGFDPLIMSAQYNASLMGMWAVLLYWGSAFIWLYLGGFWLYMLKDSDNMCVGAVMGVLVGQFSLWGLKRFSLVEKSISSMSAAAFSWEGGLSGALVSVLVLVDFWCCLGGGVLLGVLLGL